MERSLGQMSSELNQALGVVKNAKAVLVKATEEYNSALQDVRTLRDEYTKALAQEMKNVEG